MRKPVITIIVVLCVVGLTLGGWNYLMWRSHRKYKEAKESFEFDIRRDLPPGTEAKRLLGFLDAHRIAYVEIDPVHDEAEKEVWASDPWYTGASKRIQGNTQWIDTLASKCRLEVEFTLDKDEKLLAYRDHGSCKETLF
jgi:hypothetical protein